MIISTQNDFFSTLEKIALSDFYLQADDFLHKYNFYCNENHNSVLIGGMKSVFLDLE